MRLRLEKLWEPQNIVGTAGTIGTANVHARPRVPNVFPSQQRVGTTENGGADSFPMFPTVPRDREHGIASTHPPVPSVPAVPSVRSEDVNTVGASERDPLAHHPAAWEDDLHKWASAHCFFRDQAWGGIAALHRRYVEWSHASDHLPPATLATFRAWLMDQRFTLAECGLVYGLVLANDLRTGRVLTAERVPAGPRVLAMPTRRVQ